MILNEIMPIQIFIKNSNNKYSITFFGPPLKNGAPLYDSLKKIMD